MSLQSDTCVLQNMEYAWEEFACGFPNLAYDTMCSAVRAARDWGEHNGQVHQVFMYHDCTVEFYSDEYYMHCFKHRHDDYLGV